MTKERQGLSEISDAPDDIEVASSYGLKDRKSKKTRGRTVDLGLRKNSKRTSVFACCAVAMGQLHTCLSLVAPSYPPSLFIKSPYPDSTPDSTRSTHVTVAALPPLEQGSFYTSRPPTYTRPLSVSHLTQAILLTYH